jgi:signal transduction histidine kinase
MKKPWQVWTLFLLCLALVVPAMTWLSFKILELDRQRETDRLNTEVARQQAELQEIISSALYRMDWKLMPIVAQEAARPYYLYQSFYRAAPLPDVDGVQAPELTDASVEQPSPLLVQSSEFVNLHFQIGPNNQFTSPQRPVGEKCQQAMACCGITQATVDSSAAKLAKASSFCDYESILVRCPALEKEAPGNSLDSSQTTYFMPALSDASEQVGGLSEATSTYPRAPSIARTQRTYGDGQLLNKIEAQQELSNRRGSDEFQQRQKSAGSFANDWARNQLDYNVPQLINSEKNQELVCEGVMRPMWFNDQLLLARRVNVGGETVVQCCWLNWPKIEEALKQETADLLPEMKLEPVHQNVEPAYGRALATLPVQVVVDTPKLLASLAMQTSDSTNGSPPSGLRAAMTVAWMGLGLAALAVVGLLHGVMRLSERRATFVSAVTHELRTPLTTFRMYAEMLAEKMVPPEKQQHYAQTLQVQADRLTHLVENVLQFARLEKGSTGNRKETVSVGEMFSRFAERLRERAQQANMQIQLDMDADVADTRLTTDVQTIEQIVFNLVDNACKYARNADDRNIEIDATQNAKMLEIRVRDHGPGIDPKYRRRMFQPFCKSDLDAANTAPGVGLGLALCLRMAKSLGGRLFMRDSHDGVEVILQIPR